MPLVFSCLDGLHTAGSLCLLLGMYLLLFMADVHGNAAVAVARQAAQLGLPTVVSCLATPSPAAPMQPAVEATLQLLQRVISCLRHTQHSSWPAPANMPRAHFPFPVRPAAEQCCQGYRLQDLSEVEFSQNLNTPDVSGVP